MNNQKGYVEVVVTVIVVAVIGLLIWWGVSSHGAWVDRTTQNVTIKIKDKERAWNNNRDEDQYLIFTQDEVFENTDSWHKQKYNSSDVYNQLEAGKTYECEVYGERNPRYSRYRNIVACEEVKS